MTNRKETTLSLQTDRLNKGLPLYSIDRLHWITGYSRKKIVEYLEHRPDLMRRK